ncbi:hypothetical protein ACLQ3B_05205 [Micromonospora sp. DT53]|uniref:hypothetical protein n=1 Tax=Micromonospora sp. DT53 TaxID=3393444 RepID=UPI003CEE8B4E
MFGSDGLVRAADGTMSYHDQPENLVRMLSNAVAGNGRREAVAEVGGPRLTYDELWTAAPPVGRRVFGSVTAAC